MSASPCLSAAENQDDVMTGRSARNRRPGRAAPRPESGSPPGRSLRKRGCLARSRRRSAPRWRGTPGGSPGAAATAPAAASEFCVRSAGRHPSARASGPCPRSPSMPARSLTSNALVPMIPSAGWKTTSSEKSFRIKRTSQRVETPRGFQSNCASRPAPSIPSPAAVPAGRIQGQRRRSGSHCR